MFLLISFYSTVPYDMEPLAEAFKGLEAIPKKKEGLA